MTEKAGKTGKGGTAFDFALVEDDQILLKDEKKSKAPKKAKPMGRPKKNEPLRKKQVSTYLSEDEYQRLTEKLAGVPVALALRNLLTDLIEKD